MTRTHRTLAALCALSAFAFVGASAAPAAACGDAWGPAIFMEPEVDHRPDAVARAEKQLLRGDTAAAAGSIVRAMPHIATLNAKKSRLVARGQQVLAVALARHGGALPASAAVSGAGARWLGKTAEDRAANLSWAAEAMRKVDATRKDDPRTQADLAEVLSHVSETETEARNILEDLARRDVLPSASGYATLSRLRAAAGDAAGAAEAHQRCGAMAGEDRGVCGAAPSAPQAAT